MCAKFGCGPTVVSKKGGGTDRQTDKQRETAALYSRYNYNVGFVNDRTTRKTVELDYMSNLPLQEVHE